jgi:hypothetical protein
VNYLDYGYTSEEGKKDDLENLLYKYEHEEQKNLFLNF